MKINFPAISKIEKINRKVGISSKPLFGSELTPSATSWPNPFV